MFEGAVRSMTARALLLGVCVALGPGLLAQEPGSGGGLTAPPAGVSLTGRWKLDPRLSDEGGDEAREATNGLQSEGDRRRKPRPHFPDPGGYPGDPGGAAPSGPGVDVTTPGLSGPAPGGDPFEPRGSGRSSRSKQRAALDYVHDLPEILTIAQRPELILIEEDDDEGRIRALRPDGIRVRSTDGKSENRARWTKGLLHVETWHDDGVRTEEVFDVAPDRTLLTVTVHVDDGGSVIAVERIFRPDKTGES